MEKAKSTGNGRVEGPKEREQEFGIVLAALPAAEPEKLRKLSPAIAPIADRIGYARVSTADGRQVTLRQEDALHGAGVVRIFVDRISGTKSERPQFSAMLEFLRPGDEVTVMSLDRLGRGGVRQILDLIERIEARAASLRLLDLDISTRTPVGMLLLAVVAQIAAIEVESIRSRVQAGVESARARGRIGGRPPSMSPAQKEEARTMHAAGRPTGEIAELLGCSSRTVRRVVHHS